MFVGTGATFTSASGALDVPATQLVTANGSVNASLNLDKQGKGLSFHLLTMTVRVPTGTKLRGAR